MAKGDEKILSKLFIRILKAKLIDFPKIEIGEKVKILSDLTCLPDKEIFKLGLGFTETDITFYKKIPFDKKNLETNNLFKFIRDAKNDSGYLNIPIVILELKSGSITSDAIRSRTVVAQHIKRIFPNTSYFFIGENTNKTQETLLRQGKDFDSYFIMDKKITKTHIINLYNGFIKPKLENYNLDNSLD